MLIHTTFIAACTNGQIRLYDGAAVVTDNGMLQICKSHQWRAVCDYRWTQAHSIVVCKQLGYNNTSEFYTHTHTHTYNGILFAWKYKLIKSIYYLYKCTEYVHS